MMKSNATLIFLTLTALFLQGCSDSKYTTRTAITPAPVVRTPVAPVPVAPPPSSQLTYLKQCLTNADELVKINGKYRSDRNELQSLITEAKSYAAFSDGTAENIRKVIAPLFEYKINYKCNSINSFIIEEINNRVQRINDRGGNRS